MMTSLKTVKLFFILLALCFSFPISNAGASGTWEKIHHVPGADWQDVFFLDESHGWAVGWDGAVIATEDGGENWTILHRESAAAKAPYYEASFFVSEEEGWIVGNAFPNGMIFSTENGGKTIEERMRFPGAWLYDVYFISQNEGWIVGQKDEGTFIVHTEDAGDHWEVQGEGNRGWLNKVHFIDENKGFAVGTSGMAFESTPLVFQTDDGGRTWNRQLNLTVRMEGS